MIIHQFPPFVWIFHMSSKMVPTYDFWALSSRATVAAAWPWQPSGPPTLCKSGGFPLPYIGFVRKYDTPRSTGQSSFSALKLKRKMLGIPLPDTPNYHSMLVIYHIIFPLYPNCIPILHILYILERNLNHLRILICCTWDRWPRLVLGGSAMVIPSSPHVVGKLNKWLLGSPFREYGWP